MFSLKDQKPATTLHLYACAGLVTPSVTAIGSGKKMAHELVYATSPEQALGYFLAHWFIKNYSVEYWSVVGPVTGSYPVIPGVVPIEEAPIKDKQS